MQHDSTCEIGDPPNRSYVGINQRVHVSMPGDADHLGATSAWTSFRITS